MSGPTAAIATYSLPGPVVIGGAGKIADMIFIYTYGLGGEDDFRCLRLKKAMLKA
jgi:hypothetical protein